MISKDTYSLLERIVRAGRRNNKMFDYAAITLEHLNSRNPQKIMLGESLAQGKGLKVSMRLVEDVYPPCWWLGEPHVVEEGKLGGKGVALTIKGKTYKYVAEDMTAEELLAVIEDIWNNQGVGRVMPFLKNRANKIHCYAGSKNDSEIGQIMVGI